MTLLPTWRKSSSSTNGQNCVEVRSDLGAVRDTKNPATPLPVGRTALAALVRSLR